MCVCVFQADSKHANIASKRPESYNGRAASSSLAVEVRYADTLKPLLLHIHINQPLPCVHKIKKIVNNLVKPNGLESDALCFS